MHRGAADFLENGKKVNVTAKPFVNPSRDKIGIRSREDPCPTYILQIADSQKGCST
jgi:hypothetical protein